MRRIACVLPLLAGIPSALVAQVTLSFPRLQRPVVRAAVGPLTLVASIGKEGVKLGGTPRERATVPRTETRRPEDVHSSAASILATATSYVGTRYRYGGESPATGFDCSGFVQYVFAKHGVELPRTSRLQAHAGKALPLDIGALHPGDLLLFASNGTGINHVAIFAGHNRFVHSSAGAGGVVYDDLSTARGQWYLKRLVSSRRVL
jgi:cell wall-associated NlpC family hydrolase